MLVLIATIGSLNVFILPIRQNLDENTHYYHALEVADGKIRKQVKWFFMISPDFLTITKLPSISGYGSEINANLYHQEFLELTNMPSDYKEELLNVDGFNNSAHFLGAIGIKFGRLISDKLFVSYIWGVFSIYFSLLY